MTVSKDDQELADRVSARMAFKDENLKEATHKAIIGLSQLCSLGRLMKACYTTDRDALFPEDWSEIGGLVRDLSEGAMQKVDDLADRYEDLLYDAKYLSKEGEQ